MLKIVVIAMAVVSLLSTDAFAAARKPSASLGDAAFKAECEILGGTFRRDPETGTLFCSSEFGVKMCDAGGVNCVYLPRNGKKPYRTK